MNSLFLDREPPAIITNWIDAGDCIELMRALPSGCVDLAFADPPFNINYEYDVYEDGRSAEEYLAWVRAWGSELARVMKPDGTLWVMIGDEFAAELKTIFHRDLWLSLRSWVIWYYTFGVNCTAKLTRSHAHLFYFVKDPKKFTFQPEAIRVPSARQLIYNDKRAKQGGRLPDDTWILRPQDVPGGFEPDSDTWSVPRVCGTFKERKGWHGCQMPERILGRIIRACSKPGEIVLDPFCGSGTTAAVARKLDRRYVSFDLSPDYAANARERLASCSPGDPLAGDDEWFAAPKVKPAKTEASI